MITDAIINVVLGFFEFVLALLPVWEAPAISTVAMWDLGAKMAAFDAWLNVGLLITLLEVVVVVYVGLLATRIVIWLYEHIPFKAS